MHSYGKEKEGYKNDFVSIYLRESNRFSNAKLTDTFIVFILTVQLYWYTYY